MESPLRALTDVDNSVRLLMLQFTFSNVQAVPACLRQLPRETLNESLARRKVATGTRVIDPIENVDLVTFLDQLELSEYELVDALYQERVDQRNTRRTCHMVRFVFASREHARPLSEFVAARSTILEALHSMCQQAMWRVRVFLNPLFEEGKDVPGEHAMSINLEARKPLFDNKGTPVKVWRKNNNGERIGDAPVPLRPSFQLTLFDRILQVQPLV